MEYRKMANLVEAARKSLNGESVNEAMRPFSSKELAQLKAAYGKIDRVDPSSPTYKKLLDRLDGMSKEHLKQVRDAKIKFLSLLAANRLRNLGEDIVKGGLADGKSVSDLATKHGVSEKEIEAQLDKGMKVEMEHTDDEEMAREIATDHVFEDPKYYDKLAKIEKEGKYYDADSDVYMDVDDVMEGYAFDMDRIHREVTTKGKKLGTDKKFGRHWYEYKGQLWVHSDGSNFMTNNGSVEVPMNKKIIRGLVKEETNLTEAPDEMYDLLNQISSTIEQFRSEYRSYEAPSSAIKRKLDELKTQLEKMQAKVDALSTEIEDA